MSTLRNNFLKKYQEVMLGENVTPERVAEIATNQNGKYSPFDKIVIKTHYGDQILPVTEAWIHEDTLHLSVEVPDNI